jgi:hypothetical protein
MKPARVKTNGVKIIFRFVTVLFLILLISKITVHIKFEGRGWSTYFLYVLFLLVFTLKMKTTWFLGFLYSMYALYYYFLIPDAYPTNTEFTLPLVELLFGNGTGFSTSSPLVPYLFMIPFFFYLTYSLTYSTSFAIKLYSSLLEFKKQKT